MCCAFSILFLIGPRAAIIAWWLIDTAEFREIFGAVWWPTLGIIFLPWTTLIYLIVQPYGIEEYKWLWLALGILVDLMYYIGSGWGNRKKFLNNK